LGHTTIRLGTISEDEVIAIKDVAPPAPKKEPDVEMPLTEERRSRTRKELELICKVSELIQEPLEIKGVLEKVLGLLFHSLPRIDRAAIILVDKGRIKKYFAKSRQEQVDETAPYSQAVVDLVLKGGKALKMSMETDGTMTPLSESWETLRIRSVMCVPMRSRSRLCGLLYVEGLREHQAFREEDLLLLKVLSGLLALAIESA
jgi:adenylate cyclase